MARHFLEAGAQERKESTPVFEVHARHERLRRKHFGSDGFGSFFRHLETPISTSFPTLFRTLTKKAEPLKIFHQPGAQRRLIRATAAVGSGIELP
jgi:hypothetical protein